MSTVPRLSTQSVLVVEDNREVRAWICETLRTAFEGVACTSVGTCIEAECLLFGRDGVRQAFDLVLMDIGLPDGSGIDIIRKIADNLAQTLPIVITIYDDDRTLFDALAAGAKGYILKGVTMASLVEQLRRIDRGEPPLSPQMALRMMAHFKAFSRLLPPDAETPVDGEALTHREEEVLSLLGKGLTAQDIAGKLGVSRNTCATHIKAIYRKLRIASRAEAALEADRRGLL
ncbi:response regulator [Pararhizobium sp. O133]|uniref:response regulator n=1 Tax=Pararhizobium sp. O133 TaxID=3449278 RepID=UPI003F68474F